MEEVSQAEMLKKIKSLLLTGDREQMNLALMLAESNQVDLTPLEEGIKSIIKVAELQPRLGQWVHAKMENLLMPLAMVLAICIDEVWMNELPAEIAFFRRVGIMELHDIYLEKLPDEIRYLHNLRSLSLKNNRIQELPEAIGSLKNLKSLNLHNNLIHSLPESMSDLPVLELLELSKNPNLKVIPNWVRTLPKLKRLILDKTVFGEKIPESLVPLPDTLNIEWEHIRPKFER